MQREITTMVNNGVNLKTNEKLCALVSNIIMLCMCMTRFFILIQQVEILSRDKKQLRSIRSNVGAGFFLCVWRNYFSKFTSWV